MSTTLTHRRGKKKAPAERATRETPLKWSLYLFGGTGAALLFAVPLVFALVRSLQPNDVIVEAPDLATFFQWNLDNFRELAAQSELGRSVINSLVVSLSTAALTALLATLAGYGFAKFPFRMRPWLFGAVLLTMMVPFQAILTPLYLQLNIMGLTDSLFGLVLFYTTVNLPFCVFVMRNSFAAIPDELEAAAHVDGAGTVRMLVSVLRPLILPGVATAALYAFLASWTEFLAAADLPHRSGPLHAPGEHGEPAAGGLRRGELRADRLGRRRRHDPLRRPLHCAAAVLCRRAGQRLCQGVRAAQPTVPEHLSSTNVQSGIPWRGEVSPITGSSVRSRA